MSAAPSVVSLTCIRVWLEARSGEEEPPHLVSPDQSDPYGQEAQWLADMNYHAMAHEGFLVQDYREHSTQVDSHSNGTVHQVEDTVSWRFPRASAALAFLQAARLPLLSLTAAPSAHLKGQVGSTVLTLSNSATYERLLALISALLPAPTES